MDDCPAITMISSTAAPGRQPAVGSPLERGVRPLTERLRAYSADTMLCDDYADAMQDAADEIDRLNAQRREWQAEREALLARLARCGIEARREERERLMAEWNKPDGLLQGPFA